jgi:hypothetical protein
MACSCENVDELSGFLKGAEFRGHLRKYQLLKDAIHEVS